MLAPRHDADRAARAPAKWATSWPGSRAWPTLRVGDTLTAGEPTARPSRCLATARPSRWCSAASSRSTPTTTTTCATPWRSCSSTTPRCSTSPRPRWRSGFGFRCGFLGLLHMEIVRERLEREYDLELLATTPNVEYQRHHAPRRGDARATTRSSCRLHDRSRRSRSRTSAARSWCPKECVGAVMELCQDRRGVFVDDGVDREPQRGWSYDLPLAEIVLDFYDQLKSRTRGYASLDYEIVGYREAALVKLDILLNGEPVDALSMIVHRDQAYARGSEPGASGSSRLIPRQLFEVPIQAAIGGKILARETVKAQRKDVLAKCYGGDISRKRKLLEQPEGGQEAHEAGRGRSRCPRRRSSRCSRSATTAGATGSERPPPLRASPVLRVALRLLRLRGPRRRPRPPRRVPGRPRRRARPRGRRPRPARHRLPGRGDPHADAAAAPARADGADRPAAGGRRRGEHRGQPGDG